MKVKRKIIHIDEERCDGCGQCVPSCAEGAIEILDGKARVIAEKYCDGLGACLGECPNDALTIVEREAEEFDEEAVEEMLKGREDEGDELPPGLMTAGAGCPSSQVRSFGPAFQSSSEAGGESALSHWPVQIKLVPPTAPFLKQADLLIVADCVPVAFPTLHRDFLPGRVVMMGCPKFDNAQEYVQKFVDIFKNADLKSITVLDMEVPCCSALPAIVMKALTLSKANLPIERVTVTTRGSVLKREKMAA
jgi:Pyruvate/2-oxoacid:ferredoxin oxidoreductase delta subunit